MLRKSLNLVIVLGLLMSLTAAKPSRVSVATPRQLIAADTWTVYTTTNSDLPSNEVRGITVAPDGTKWIATVHGGVAHFDGTTWTVYNQSNSGLPSNIVSQTFVDNDGSKWFATDYYVGRFDDVQWTVYGPGNSTLLDNEIVNVVEDHSGAKWFPTWGGGASRFDGMAWTPYAPWNSGLPGDYITNIAVDLDGAKWFAGWGAPGGISRFDDVNWTFYNTSNSGLPEDTVAGVLIDRDGTKWFGTGHSGLVRFDGANWTVYSLASLGLPDTIVVPRAFDATGNLWIGSSYGAVRFNGTTARVYNTSNSGLPDNSAYNIVVDTDGSVWFGTNNGVGVLSPEIPSQTAVLFAASRHESFSTNEVYRYEVPGPGGTPVLDLTITDPSFNSISGLAFSPSGELFVSNVSPNYASGSISRLLDPTGVPVSNGTITSDQFTSPDGEVFVNSELFVAQVTSSNVLRFTFDASGIASFNGAITTGLCCGAPRNAAVSPAGNELFVTECCGVNEVNRYLLDASGNAVPNGVINGGGLSNPHEMAFSPWGELFVANAGSNSVSRFTFDAAGNALPNGQITGATLNVPVGLDFSPWGELFVGNHYGSGGISRFLFDSARNAIPNGFFSTPNTLGDIQFYPSASTPSSSQIALTPASASLFIGQSHTVTATLTDSLTNPQPGIQVTFSVDAGPNAGANGVCNPNADCTTDDSGQVSFTYTGNGETGLDHIKSCFTNQLGEVICSSVVTAQWALRPAIHYFALGDSIASGHGLQDASNDPNAVREDRLCRRSRFAYPYLVKTELEKRYAYVSFRHLACTGATAGEPKGKDRKPRYKWLKKQMDTVLAELPSDEPVLVSITIGANDLEWADRFELWRWLYLEPREEKYQQWVNDHVGQVKEELGGELDRLLEYPNVTVVVTELHNPFNRQSTFFTTPTLRGRGDRCGSLFVRCYERTEYAVHQLNSAFNELWFELGQPERLRIAALHEMFHGHESPPPLCGGAEVPETWIQEDCFHPNTLGAEMFAEEVYADAVRTGR